LGEGAEEEVGGTVKLITVLLFVAVYLTSAAGCASPPDKSKSEERATLEVRVQGDPNQDEVVVWVDPEDWPQGHPMLWPSVDIAKRDLELKVVGRWFLSIENSSSTTKPILVRQPDGSILDLGPYKPGSGSFMGMGETGTTTYHEFLSEDRNKVIARVLVVPSVYARLVRANETVTFTELLPGPCKVMCWSGKTESETTIVDLARGKTSRVTVSAPTTRPSR
jgi:hypothetical protein